MELNGIAALGYGCRFPGNIIDGSSYWSLLDEGRDGTSEIPPDRWSIDAFWSPERVAGKSIAKRGGFIEGIDRFEPECFGISPREARYVDPQQRLLLETAYEAMEHAGLPLERMAGSRTGVFVGISTNDYSQNQQGFSGRRSMTAFTAQGVSGSIAANRVSYCFDLRGPSLSIDTACSSAMSAFDRAVRSLHDRECDFALVGGFNLILAPDPFISFSSASMLSPDGRCKAFDASADGFARAEGGGVIVLSRLSDAVVNGDPVRAVVLGSGSNQDGRTNGMAMPNVLAQEQLLLKVYGDARLDPAKLHYVEAHGTGTAIGDPTETEALAKVFSRNRRDDDLLVIGSVKTNLGHLEAASGIASLIKAMVMIERRQIFGNLHFVNPNPKIPFEKWKLRVPLATEPWPADRKVIIGINSFGFGGANAHVIVGEHARASDDRANNCDTRREKPRAAAKPTQRRELPFVLTARSDEALRDRAGRLARHLADHDKDEEIPLDLAYTLSQRSSLFPKRIGFVAADVSEVVERLKVYLGDEPSDETIAGDANPERRNPFFVFCGQGPQWSGMGRELLAIEPVFRDSMREIDSLIQQNADWSLIRELEREESASRIHRTEFTQPALFAIQASLARLWRSWGIEPRAACGHSVGEIAAAFVSGRLSLNAAVRVIVHRGRALERHALPGRMLAVALSEQDAEALAKDSGGTLYLAAVNSPDMVTLAGPPAVMERCAQTLANRGIWSRLLQVSHAFHTPLVDPARKHFLDGLRGVDLTGDPVCAMFSTVTGRAVDRESHSPEYWWDNIRRPVRFGETVRELGLEGNAAFLEVGPHPVLASSIKQSLRGLSDGALVFASLVRGKEERRSMLNALVKLFTSGAEVKWENVLPAVGKFLELPPHPWRRESYWHETSEARRDRLPTGYHPLIASSTVDAQPVWRTTLDLQEHRYLKDHCVGGRVLFPAAGYVESSLAAVCQAAGTVSAVLTDVNFHQGLILSPDAPHAVQVVVDRENRRVSLHGRSGDEAQPWINHSEAHYSEYTSSESGDDTAALDAEAWIIGKPSFPAEQLYAEFDQVGLKYGAAFRGIHRIFYGQKCALAEVVLPAGLSAEGYLLHPALLDACFQAILAALPHELRQGKRAYIPHRIGRVRFLRTPHSRAWCETRAIQASRERITADIRVYTADGVLAAEFIDFECRGINVAGRRSSVDAHTFQLEWRHRPTDVHVVGRPLTLASDWRDAAQRADVEAKKIWNDSGPENLHRRVRKLIQSGEAYLARFLTTTGFARQGDVLDTLQLENSGRLSPNLRLYLERSLERLATTQPLQRRDGKWTLTRDLACPDIEAIWRDVLSDFPDSLPFLRLQEIAGDQLAKLLSGKISAVELFFSKEGVGLLHHLYNGDPWSRWANSFISQFVSEVSEILPRGRPLRILEVGAGLAGTTEYVLPSLADVPAEYWFTDVSSDFLAAAQDKFQQYDFLRYAGLDLNVEPNLQQVPKKAFDLVIAADVLHATDEIRKTIRHVSDYLVEGGLVILRETSPRWGHVEQLFGLFEGWWKYLSDPSRTDGPCLEPEAWRDILNVSGFEAGYLPQTCFEGGTLGTVLIARKQVAQAAPLPMSEAKSPRCRNLLIFSDANADEGLTKDLRGKGLNCILAVPGNAFAILDDQSFTFNPENVNDFVRLRDLSGLRDVPFDVVHLCAMNHEGDSELEQDRLDSIGCHLLLHFMQAFVETPPQTLYIVTRQARAVLPDEQVDAPGAAALLGMGRTIAAEYRQIDVRLIDVGTGGATVAAIWQELVTDDRQAETAWRNDYRFVPRFVPLDSARSRKRPQGVNSPYSLTPSKIGDVSSLQLVETEDLPPPAADEILVEVCYVGLNFRDVLKVLGRYPSERQGDESLGDECTGIVRDVGRDVTAFSPGDRVAVCATGVFVSHVNVAAEFAMKIPDDLTLAAACTMPVAYLTAIHSLEDVGKLKSDETVLIHAAAGGVGLAALHVANRLNATVFATAGSPPKHSVLKKYGVRTEMSSRNLDFRDGIMQLTGRRGVDVILNSLAGQAMIQSLSCLAPHGRFLEIGKQDIYKNSTIGLYSLRQNCSYHVIDLSSLLSRGSTAGRELMRRVFDVDGQRLPPLPQKVLPIAQAISGFREIMQGQHVGRITFDMTQHWGAVVDRKSRVSMNSEGSYLITGAFGGVGLAIAKWLVARGARNLVLMGRRGPVTRSAETIVEQLRTEGAKIHIAKCDVTCASAVREALDLVRATMPPLKGVYHLAMVMDDEMLDKMDAKRFDAVLHPKIRGVVHLDRFTRQDELEQFVLFGSISASMGNFGQAAYAAANAALESFAQHRRGMGLPANAIAWGPLGEVGYVAERAAVAQTLEKMGHVPLDVREMYEALDDALGDDRAISLVGKANLRTIVQLFSNLKKMPGPFSELIDAEPALNEGDASSNARGMFSEADPAEKQKLISSFIKSTVARILGANPAKIDVRRPLNELGLDSLMSVELANILESELRVSVPVSSFSRGMTIESLSIAVASRAGGTDGGAAPTGGAVGDSVTNGCLRELRASEEGIPLFCMHPAGGLLEVYDPLLAVLDNQGPIYGVQAFSDTGGELECQTVREMAAHYAAAINLQSPAGPVALLGFSFGGLLAIRVAEQLERLGREISFLGILESDPAKWNDRSQFQNLSKQLLSELYEMAETHMGLVKHLDREQLQREALVVAEKNTPQAISDWILGPHLIKAIPRGLLTEYVHRAYRHMMMAAADGGRPDVVINAPIQVWTASKGIGVGASFWQIWTLAGCSERRIEAAHYEIMTSQFAGSIASDIQLAVPRSAASLG